MCGYAHGGGEQRNKGRFWFVVANSEGEERVNRLYPLDQGGPYGCEFHSVIKCDNSGYLLGGFQPSRGYPFFTVIKTDNDGEIEWNRTYSTEDEEYGKCFAVLETKAGGFLAVGQSGGAGGRNTFAVRIDVNGDEIWQSTYEGNQWKAVIETEGGFILAGGGEGGRYLTVIFWTMVYSFN